MAYSIDIPSKRLVASYVFDWIMIIAIAAIGGGLNFVSPPHRPFSLTDLSISYPLVDESISAGALGLFALLAPAIIIVIIVAVLVPGPQYCRTHTRSEVIRRKLWEWEKGWAGLGLSLATAFFFTQALKNIFGRPRPDLIARCDPDLSNIEAHIVASYVPNFSPSWSLVRSSICRGDKTVLDDGFRSFPSGHSSFSWASMLYLSLFLASKFAIAVPFLPDRPSAHDSQLNRSDVHELLPLHHHHESTEYTSASTNKASGSADERNSNLQADVTEGASARLDRSPGRSFVAHTPLYNQAAAPPVHLIIIVAIPVCVAFYVVSTRFVEFYHHGFDIISGSFIGIVAAYTSFRWYHAPIRRGAGWAWGPRSRDRAWGIGVGTENYVGDEGWDSARGKRSQVIRGRGRGDA
ncbi:acid phosphatase/Vanadium-dependent haloperoxidase [Polychaeton citri CBS 116435]|uniref:Acid phosphatase/Vanadium-dependent haloperoxidase n=1 Tax=Polychaeton citri CBS 116435 TaxID=1314669 RepID=A0A9P4QD35_9PEZI|nr:acid phosphatase/Vanadium-dependent haloperoxidase [Polychaeton citri CBS 116435]